MIAKHPINIRRLRKVPRQFNWIDHRLVQQRHIDKCSHAAATLYLFLVTVADANGLSYYGDGTIMSRLSMDGKTFEGARTDLIRFDLIAFKRPLYQVLSLDTGQTVEREKLGQPLSLSDIFKKAKGNLR